MARESHSHRWAPAHIARDPIQPHDEARLEWVTARRYNDHSGEVRILDPGRTKDDIDE